MRANISLLHFWIFQLCGLNSFGFVSHKCKDAWGCCGRLRDKQNCWHCKRCLVYLGLPAHPPFICLFFYIVDYLFDGRISWYSLLNCQTLVYPPTHPPACRRQIKTTTRRTLIHQSCHFSSTNKSFFSFFPKSFIHLVSDFMLFLPRCLSIISACPNWAILSHLCFGTIYTLLGSKKISCPRQIWGMEGAVLASDNHFFSCYWNLKKNWWKETGKDINMFFVRVWCIDGSSVAAADICCCCNISFLCLFVCQSGLGLGRVVPLCLFVHFFPFGLLWSERWLTMLSSAQMTGTNKKCMSAVLEVIRKACEAE